MYSHVRSSNLSSPSNSRIYSAPAPPPTMAAGGSADSFTYYPPGSASGATADPASGRSEDYEEMTLKALRDLADKTPGMRSQKKVGDKWENKLKLELVAEFKPFDAKKGAQPLADPRWEEIILCVI